MIEMRNALRNITAVLAVAFLCFVLTGGYVIADETEAGDTQDYYNTYKEWVAATGTTSPTWNMITDEMDKLIEHGKEAYADGDATEAFNAINNAYYGWYETTGFERVAMGYISGSRKTEMELQFSKTKAVTKSGGTVDEFDSEADTLSSMLHEDANVLDGVSSDSSDEEEEDSSSGTTSSTSSQTAASVAAFLACFGIILREGFEAILVVGAIAAYLLKRGRKTKTGAPMTGSVYMGAILGIVASFLTAWLLNIIKLANSASQEVIEGITALIAVCVLFYVSNWMLSKSTTQAWTSYIRGKVEQSTEVGSVFALAFTSFLAVYREGAEVILFFQPMISGNYDKGAVWGGFVTGCICLVGVWLAIHLLSLTIPIRPFFTATSILMAVMCVSFLGGGIKELIEGDVIVIWVPSWAALVPSNSLLEILGIYPCGQTLIAQAILAVIFIIIFVMQHKKNKEQRAKLIAEHPEILEHERLSKRATKQDVVDIVNEKIASLQGGTVAEQEIKAMVNKAVQDAIAKALPQKK